MSTIQPVGQANFPELEERITKFWRENDIFQKSIDQRPDDDIYKFVDGPPFVTGNPHYGSLLPSIAKDVIPRYWTMKGKKVRRVWGWDCHGLPIEDKVNRKLGITSQKDIEEKIGIDRYIQECRDYVHDSSSNWRWYIDKIGRWVDMDHAYYTMSPEFMESVIWGFKQVYNKGLVYKGKRVSLYSTDSATPVSNFEVAMDADNYRDIEDLSVFVKFRISDPSLVSKTVAKERVYLVAWTTTPWTIPVNFALAVNPKATYVLVLYNNEYLIVAKDRLAYSLHISEEEIGASPDKLAQVIAEVKGEKLKGLQYEPVYQYFVDSKTQNDFHVYLSNDVVLDEGTGVLHIAPAFGEVDYNMGLEYGLSAIRDIDEEGKITIDPWKGVYLRDASPLIAEDMAQKQILLRSEQYTHRLPFYRGDNPLIYMAQDAYFINVQKIKDRMLELNERVNWVPEHIKDGRFAKTVATSPDWCISRTRYWATIMPIWKSEDGDEIVVGSIEEMMQYTKQISKKEVDGKVVYAFEGKSLDLHKDVCDKLVFEKDGKKYYRIPEVLDCWMDSGSVPFAEYHYPFENQQLFEKDSAADYIIEYVAQVRAWFNVLLRLSTIIFDNDAFENVICTGVLAGNDGRKMSKSYGNYPDPKEVLEKIGGEALRLYFMGSPIMAGDDMNWSDEGLKDQIKNVLLPIWNTFKYVSIYANLHNWSPKTTAYPDKNPLDIWMHAYMDHISLMYAKRLEEYNIPASVRCVQESIDTISSWYIRRSRQRFANNDPDALQTLFATLVQFAKTFAPQMPFVTEEIYQNLVVATGITDAKESVHLELYPEGGNVNEQMLSDMERVRHLSSLGQSIRVTNGIKVRQPLQKAYVPMQDTGMQEIIRDELNVKEVVYAAKPKIGEGLITNEEKDEQGRIDFVTLDITLTPALKEEGNLHDLLRHIQNARKLHHLKMEDVVTLLVHTDSKALQKMLDEKENEIHSAVNVKDVQSMPEKLAYAIKIDGEEISVSFEK